MLSGFFREDSPQSMTRLIHFLSFVVGVGLAFYGVFMNRDLGGLSILVGSFLASGTITKTVGKVFEGKKPEAPVISDKPGI